MRRPSPAQLARAERAQAERRRRALIFLADWEKPMPPCCGVGIGQLVWLEGQGYARRLPDRDRVGDLRFEITDQGREALCQDI